MAQIYKIYMNQSVLIIADFEPKNSTNFQRVDIENFKLKELFKESKNMTNPAAFWLFCQQPTQIFKGIKKSFTIIRAAGGLVKNGKGDLLMIFRLGKWDLPKGKVDDGEGMRHAAVREVEEECGVKVHYLGQKKLTTYHMYHYKGEVVIKKTNWYDMGVNKNPKLIPQKEENITKAGWFAKDEMEKVRANTYPLIFDILTDLD